LARPFSLLLVLSDAVDYARCKAYIAHMTFAATKPQAFGTATEALAADKLVLATVNAPYKRDIDAATLQDCLVKGDFGDWPVHVATFFTDVAPDLVFGFAEGHGIPKLKLAEAYLAMRAKTGERNPNLEAVLAPLASSPR
jgi:hypothetical protein